MERPIEDCDSACEPLTHAEVSRLPDDLLAEIDEAALDARYGPFVCALRGTDVEIDVAGKVKAELYRSVNASNYSDDRHRHLHSASKKSKREVAPNPHLWTAGAIEQTGANDERQR
jgi:hypothetical protein